MLSFAFSIFDGLNSSIDCGIREDDALSLKTVNAVTCDAAVTLPVENMGRITRSNVVDLPLPASPIRNRCGNFTLCCLKYSLTKHPAHHARMGTVFSASLKVSRSRPSSFNTSAGSSSADNMSVQISLYFPICTMSSTPLPLASMLPSYVTNTCLPSRS